MCKLMPYVNVRREHVNFLSLFMQGGFYEQRGEERRIGVPEGELLYSADPYTFLACPLCVAVRNEL